MDKPIEVGDLVVVNAPTPCCRNSLAIGRIFVVTKLVTAVGECEFCHSWHRSLYAAPAGPKEYCFESYSTLKKIPPLSELESVETHEEVPA